jgi:hypothetical protein
MVPMFALAMEPDFGGFVGPQTRPTLTFWHENRNVQRTCHFPGM